MKLMFWLKGFAAFALSVIATCVSPEITQANPGVVRAGNGMGSATELEDGSILTTAHNFSMQTVSSMLENDDAVCLNEGGEPITIDRGTRYECPLLIDNAQTLSRYGATFEIVAQRPYPEIDPGAIRNVTNLNQLGFRDGWDQAGFGLEALQRIRPGSSGAGIKLVLNPEDPNSEVYLFGVVTHIYDVNGDWRIDGIYFWMPAHGGWEHRNLNFSTGRISHVSPDMVNREYY